MTKETGNVPESGSNEPVEAIIEREFRAAQEAIAANGGFTNIQVNGITLSVFQNSSLENVIKWYHAKLEHKTLAAASPAKANPTGGESVKAVIKRELKRVKNAPAGHAGTERIVVNGVELTVDAHSTLGNILQQYQEGHRHNSEASMADAHEISIDTKKSTEADTPKDAGELVAGLPYVLSQGQYAMARWGAKFMRTPDINPADKIHAADTLRGAGYELLARQLVDEDELKKGDRNR